MKPFDLPSAIAGVPVVTRAGDEVLHLTLFHEIDPARAVQRLVGVVRCNILTFEDDGRYFAGTPIESEFDLFLK